MQRQLTLPPEQELKNKKNPEDMLGLPQGLTQAALQQDVFKELINKFAWAIGSTYRLTYTKTGSKVRRSAKALATSLILYEGYPRSIGK